MPTSPSSPTRTASTVPATSSSSRPAGATDYRANIERQSREQKSVGGILSLAVYSLIGLFVLGALLAGYGAYVFSKQIHQQSVTMSDLDNRYSAQNQALVSELKTTQEALVQVQAQSQRQQEVINKLLAATTDDANAIRQEKAARAEEASIRSSETAALRARVRTLEARTESIYRP